MADVRADLPDLTDYDGAADLLCTSVRHVRRLVAERRIPFVRIGSRKVRFDRRELAAWVDEQRVEVAS